MAHAHATAIQEQDGQHQLLRDNVEQMDKVVGAMTAKVRQVSTSGILSAASVQPLGFSLLLSVAFLLCSSLQLLLLLSPYLVSQIFPF